uniref:EF-hand domain-containing protein n=1 Tax=Electrophorus electricus TaxID=8005 RepID=A0A4W4H5M1_ELEEL
MDSLSLNVQNLVFLCNIEQMDLSFSCAASSVQSVADENLSLADIESMLSQKVEGRRDDLKAAFKVFDQEGSGTVTKGEFRRVIESFLVPLTQSQFETLLAKVSKGNKTIPYMEFLQQYCKHLSAPIRYYGYLIFLKHFNCTNIQCKLSASLDTEFHLNLKNITRAFRLFDYNRDGRIQQHELRRVLESYCFPMSQQEFHSVNHLLVERALQAFDITDSGVVSHDDLRAVVSSFLFPIDDSTFLSLLSRYEVDLCYSCNICLCLTL